MSKPITAGLLGTIAFALAGCGSSPNPFDPASTVASIVLQADSLSSDTLPLIAGGDTARITAKALDASGKPVTGVSFIWATSNTSVVTISSSGLVTAVGLGEADIRVTVADPSSSVHSGRAEVDFAIREGRASRKLHTVSKPFIVITPATATIDISQTAAFQVLAKDYKGNQPWGYVSATWSSSQSSVASVSPPATGSSASALGVSYGTTTITAVVFIGKYGRYEGYATLNVQACQGALNVPSWTVDNVTYSYAPLGLTKTQPGGTYSYSIDESGTATDKLAVNEAPHTNFDSASWYGKETGTASEANSFTASSNGSVTVTTSEATNGAAPLSGDYGILLTIKPTSYGVCWYHIKFADQYTYAATSASGTVNFNGGVIFEVIDTLPSAAGPKQWTISQNNLSITAQGVISMGGPPTGDYFIPGTELSGAAAELFVTSATVSFQIHANPK